MISINHSKHRIPPGFALGVCVVASICIHIYMLQFNLARPKIELGMGTTNEISVQIITPSEPKQKTQQKKIHPQPSEQKIAEESVKPPDTVRDTGEQQPSQQTPTDPAIQSAREQKKIIGKIRQELARYFYYPAQAQRRGIEGKVIIAFMLGRQGRIDSVSISKSSGFAILDDAALSSFRKINVINHQSEHDNPDIMMKLPVIYKLAGDYNG